MLSSIAYRFKNTANSIYSKPSLLLCHKIQYVFPHVRACHKAAEFGSSKKISCIIKNTKFNNRFNLPWEIVLMCIIYWQSNNKNTSQKQQELKQIFKFTGTWFTWRLCSLSRCRLWRGLSRLIINKNTKSCFIPAYTSW